MGREMNARALWWLLAGLLVGCASRAGVQLSPEQLRSKASYRTLSAYDEAYDAAYLVLVRDGFLVSAHDRHAGTLDTDPKGDARSPHEQRAWHSEILQEGASLTVVALPRIFIDGTEVTQGQPWTLDGENGEEARWRSLFGRMQELLDAWKVHPEVELDRARGELNVGGLRLLVPPKWTHFELNTDRHSLAVQRGRQLDDAVNPSILYSIERRRPQPDEDALVRSAVDRALGTNRQMEPKDTPVSDAWGVHGLGEVRVGPAGLGMPVAWRRWEARSPAWVVRVASACAPEGEQSCDIDVRAVIESAADSSGRLIDTESGAIPVFKHRPPPR